MLGAQTVAGWATRDLGRAGERSRGQTLAFVVSADTNAARSRRGPAIDASHGQL
ncbi:MAG: hypothetical protein MZU95_06460 [Desulfomicrobium escambiense]|nr:hypothetical protein [Desulfomicrobium escambiense]